MPWAVEQPVTLECSRTPESIVEDVGVDRVAGLRILLDEEPGDEDAGTVLGRPRRAGDVLAADADLSGSDARVTVEEVSFDIAGRVVRRLVGRVGHGRTVDRPGRELDEAL